MFYKFFERWGLGKGLTVGQVVNSGHTLGDARVDLTTLAQALRLALRGTEGTPDVLVISVDSAPAFVGAAFYRTLEGMREVPSSCVLLQPPHGTSDGSPFAVGSGPVVRSYYTSKDGVYVVGDLLCSLQCSSEPPCAAATPPLDVSFTPLVFRLAHSDAVALTTPAAVRAVSDFVRGIVAAEIEAGAEESDETSPELVVPIEAGVAWLARSGARIVGLRLGEKFLVGACDGSPHALPKDEAVEALAAVQKAAAAAALSGGGGSPPSTKGAPMTKLLASRGVSMSRLFSHEPINTKAYARAGVLGNPTDGYGGKTLSVTLANFYAEAWITPGADSSIHLVPHPLYDPQSFASLRQASVVAGREGYSGGLRLMHATLHRFYQLAESKGAVLSDKGFSMRYHTTVPRQVGLAGSSAIITALLRALLKVYGFGDAKAASVLGLTKDTLPAFVLAIEQDELGITAGLQDRVVQAYEGAVHMNFDPAVMAAQGHGNYTPLPVEALPPLFLAYAADPSDSGRIHAPVKQRWLDGDAVVVAGMNKIAALADAGMKLCTGACFWGSGVLCHPPPPPLLTPTPPPVQSRRTTRRWARWTRRRLCPSGPPCSPPTLTRGGPSLATPPWARTTFAWWRLRASAGRRESSPGRAGRCWAWWTWRAWWPRAACRGWRGGTLPPASPRRPKCCVPRTTTRGTCSSCCAPRSPPREGGGDGKCAAL